MISRRQKSPFIPSTVEKRSATAHDGAAIAGAALLREHRSITVPFACVRTTEPSSVASKRLMLTRKLGFFAHARSIRANVSCSVAGCSQLSSVTPSTRGADAFVRLRTG